MSLPATPPNNERKLAVPAPISATVSSGRTRENFTTSKSSKRPRVRSAKECAARSNSDRSVSRCSDTSRDRQGGFDHPSAHELVRIRPRIKGGRLAGSNGRNRLVVDDFKSVAVAAQAAGVYVAVRAMLHHYPSVTRQCRRDEAGLGRDEAPHLEVRPVTDHNGIGGGIDGGHIHRHAERDSEAFALTHGVATEPAVLSDHCA